MIPDTRPAAPDELLARAADNLRRRAGIPLVFGGFGAATVPVTMSVGGDTGALTSMVIRPARGLGGKAMVQARLMAVPEYGRAADITHDYDEPVLAEGVVGLAVAPLTVGARVCGLLYAATRTPAALDHDLVGWLAAEAQAVSFEVSVRAAVEHRVGELMSRSGRLWEIARETSDPGARDAIRQLLGVPPTGVDLLTARQRQVLELAETGLRNAEIGARLGLSEQTVKGYMRALMARLNARSRQEAVHKYRHR
ncbi:helix-turn-helix transcriptional regulator [Micromonosporaceae bacterium Da 78-11]